MPLFLRLSIALLLTTALSAGEALEVHSFASVGGYRTWGNNWISASDEDGSIDLWEFALNASSTPFSSSPPFDRLRLNAQVFARDFGVFDNRRIQLDLANADYRFSDGLGLQVGRLRLSSGLYSEILDIDTARVPVLLPVTIYSLSARDLFLSTDGAKLYGYLSAGGDSGIEYALYAGDKSFERDGGLAAYFRETGLGPEIRDIDLDLLAGGMAHWHTPIPGLGIRVSALEGINLDVIGFDPATGIQVASHTDRYLQIITGLEYQIGSLTLAAEYQRRNAHIRNTVSIAGATIATVDSADQGGGAYLSATWNALRRVDLYAAVEGDWRDTTSERMPPRRTLVGAVRWDPIDHLLIKAEVEFVRGTGGLAAGLNPDGLAEHWWLAAIKSTVDF
jgi:hypothetical protein